MLVVATAASIREELQLDAEVKLLLSKSVSHLTCKLTRVTGVQYTEA